MFVRPCFERLSDKIVQLSGSLGEGVGGSRILLLGTAGTGRSFFGFFLLWKLVKSGVRRIAFHTRRDGLVLLSNERGAGTVSVVSDPRMLLCAPAGPRPWYIADGIDGEPFPASDGTTTVFLARDGAWHGWLDEGRGKARLFLPEWTPGEFDDLRRLVFPDIPKELPEDAAAEATEATAFTGGWVSRLRTKYFGGAPRAVFAPEGDVALWLRLTREAVGRVTVSCLAACSPGCEFPDHRIVHWSASDDFAAASPVWASRFVQLECANRITLEEPVTLARFLASGRGGHIRSVLFEEVFHRQVVHGGDFAIRQFAPDPADAAGVLIRIPASSKRSPWAYPEELDTFEPTPGVFYRAPFKSFEVFDSLAVLDLSAIGLGRSNLVGFSVSYKCNMSLDDVAISKLRSISKRLDVPPVVIFAVPDFDFAPDASSPTATDEEPEQQSMDEPVTVVGEATEEEIGIPQFVMSIPIDAQHIRASATEFL